MAVALPWADELARRGRDAQDPEVRAAAAVLDVVIDDLAGMLGSRFVRVAEGAPRADVFGAYLEDHRHERP